MLLNQPIQHRFVGFGIEQHCLPDRQRETVRPERCQSMIMCATPTARPRNMTFSLTPFRSKPLASRPILGYCLTYACHAYESVHFGRSATTNTQSVIDRRTWPGPFAARGRERVARRKAPSSPTLPQPNRLLFPATMRSWKRRLCWMAPSESTARELVKRMSDVTMRRLAPIGQRGVGRMRRLRGGRRFGDSRRLWRR